MKTKLILAGFLALALLSKTNAQNTSYTADALPVPGTGTNNCAIGVNALIANTSGHDNDAIGFKALWNNTTGAYNSAVGTFALFQNTSGISNIAQGNGALANNTIGGGNTGLAVAALNSVTTGSYNTGVGLQSLLLVTTGTANSGFGALSNVISTTVTNAAAIGYAAVAPFSNVVQLGNGTVNKVTCSICTYVTTSDVRFKTNIREDDVKGLDFITRLRPVVYNMDAKKLTEFTTKNFPDSIRKLHLNQDFASANKTLHSGFIAQEVEKAAKEAGYNFNGVSVPQNDNETYSLAYAQFVVPLVKAVQEQQDMIKNLKQEIELLRASGTNTTSDVTGLKNVSPGNSGFKMEQNVPNPFNGETSINYTIPANTTNAFLRIYDLSGKQISSMPLPETGSSSVKIDSDKLISGIYLYSIIMNGKIMDTKRMVIDK